MSRRRCARPAVISLAMALLCTTAPGTALGQEASTQEGSAVQAPRIVVFPIEAADAEHAHIAGELTAEIVSQSQGHDLRVTTAQASFSDTALIAGCAEPSQECFVSLREQLGADQGITGTLSAADTEGRLRLTLVLFGANDTPVTREFELTAGSAGPELAREMPSLFEAGAGTTETAVAGPRQSFSRGSAGSMPWIALGGGGALVGSGALFWMLASQKESEIADAPVATVEDLERLAALERSAQRRATIGNGLFLAGLAAVTVGAVLSIRQGAQAQSGQESSITVAPMPVPGGMGVTLTLGWTP